MTPLPESLRAVVDRGALAHLATIDPDGSPQVSVVWIGRDGDTLLSAHMGRYRKVRNIERDPRVTVSFLAPAEPGEFMARHAVLRCRGEVVAGGAMALLKDLGSVYVGPDFAFPGDAGPDAGYVVRYTVDRIGGVGPWAE